MSEAAYVVEIVLTVLFSLTLAGLTLALFRPAWRGVANPLIYFTSGGQARKDLILRRRVLLDNLRDIRIEKENGKLSENEYAALAQPLADELKRVDDALAGGAAPVRNGASVRRNRLGWICPACGAQNHASRESEIPADAHCIQCGHVPDFKESRS
jgi:hypothetical protein